MPDFAAVFAVLIIGLFVGTNLGVLLMCLMRMASPDTDEDSQDNKGPRTDGSTRPI